MDPLIERIFEVIVTPIVYLLFAVAIVVFLIGIVQLIAKADDEQARKDGQRNIAYGILGLVIMTGAWGLIYFIDGTIDELSGTEGETLLDDFEGL